MPAKRVKWSTWKDEMGERMGSVLAEVRRLREQTGTVEIHIKAGVIQEVVSLPSAWNYKIVEEDPQ